MSDPHAAKPVAVDDEPKTPMWLPALGAALFTSIGLWWAVTPADPPPAAVDQAVSASAATAVPALAGQAPQAPPAVQPMPQPQPTMPRPTMSAGAAPPIPSGAVQMRQKRGKP